MKKLKHEAELFKAALLAGVQYAEGRGAVEFEATDSASDKAFVRLSSAGSRQDHRADAGRTGQREDDSASAGDVVCTSIAQGASADAMNRGARRRTARARCGKSPSNFNCGMRAGPLYSRRHAGRAIHPATPKVTHEGGVMVTKRESPVKKTTKRKAASAAPRMTDSAAMLMLESAQSAMRSTRIDPDVRRQLVAAEAYFRAERRGFAAGNELDDWVAAEMAVDTRLQQSQVA